MVSLQAPCRGTVAEILSKKELRRDVGNRQNQLLLVNGRPIQVPDTTRKHVEA